MIVGAPCCHTERCCKEMEQQEIFVKFLTESVLFQICVLAQTVPLNKVDIIERLSENVWAAVKNTKLDLLQETYKKLSKEIIGDLCEIWSGANHLVCLINLNDPLIDSTIASIFKFHLTKPQTPPNAVHLFFSSFGKIMSKLFRGAIKTESGNKSS